MALATATNPALLANLVFRVILAFAGILINWVPFRLLVRNGEFAAVVFIVDVAIMNLITILNSIIWHDDNWNTWWNGAGLCDIEVYLSAPLQTIYAASIFTVMYHLAQQVRLSRAGRDRDERTRRHLVQAAIIFPVPFVQLVFTYFDLAQRYIVGTLIGCSAVYDVSWPKNVVYDAPPVVFAVLSVPYAILLWRRYRAIARQTQRILNSGGEASIRANRTRRRLYNMSLLILVVYVPVMVYYLVFTVRDTISSYKAYNYDKIHWSAKPYPWNTVLFVPSWVIPSAVMNQPWIPIATSVVIVGFFGTTMEARQMYQKYVEYVRLDTCLYRLGLRRGQAAASLADMSMTSRGTRETGWTLLPNRTRPINPIGRHLSSYEQDIAIPTIERPDSVRVAEAPSFAPSPAQTTLKTPPPIPPRFSSLRHNFGFRTPTLQSIRKSIRIPSLRGNAATVSGRSSKTASNVTELNRDDSIPMLPVYNAPRRSEAESHSRPSFGSFLARDVRKAASPVEFEAGRGLEVRVPIVRPRFTTDEGDEDAGRINRCRRGERAGFQREQTLTSLHTTSDTLAAGSHHSAGRDANSEIGIAR